jgi:hypothetical protein
MTCKPTTTGETVNGVEPEIWPTWSVGWGGVIHPAIKIEGYTIWKGSQRFNQVAAAEVEARKYLDLHRSQLIEEWKVKL